MKTIYKFRDWNNNFHKKIITDFELFLASPYSFNDPFDTKIFFDYHSMSDADYQKYIKTLYNFVDPNNPERKVPKDKLNLVLKDRSLLKKISQKVESDSMDQKVGIISFSKNIENILLWSHYGNYHMGFAVGFDTQKVENSDLLGSSGPVNYTENYDQPSFSPLESNDFLKKTFTKSIDWKYEEEYRVVKIFKEKTQPDDPKRKVNFNPELIKEICLGLNILDEHKKEILEYCEELKIPAYQMSRIEGKFMVKKNKCT